MFWELYSLSPLSVLVFLYRSCNFGNNINIFYNNSITIVSVGGISNVNDAVQCMKTHNIKILSEVIGVAVTTYAAFNFLFTITYRCIYPPPPSHTKTEVNICGKEFFKKTSTFYIDEVFVQCTKCAYTKHF